MFTATLHTVTHKITEFAAKFVVLLQTVVIWGHVDLMLSEHYSGQAIFMTYLPW